MRRSRPTSRFDMRPHAASQWRAILKCTWAKWSLGFHNQRAVRWYQMDKSGLPVPTNRRDLGFVIGCVHLKSTHKKRKRRGRPPRIGSSSPSSDRPPSHSHVTSAAYSSGDSAPLGTKLFLTYPRPLTIPSPTEHCRGNDTRSGIPTYGARQQGIGEQLRAARYVEVLRLG